MIIFCRSRLDRIRDLIEEFLFIVVSSVSVWLVLNPVLVGEDNRRSKTGLARIENGWKRRKTAPPHDSTNSTINLILLILFSQIAIMRQIQ